MALFPRYQGPPLLDAICTVENLTEAWRRVRSNIQFARRRHSSGPDAVTISDFERDWVQQMESLVAELRTGTYRPLPPRRVAIPKASGGERAIAILAVRDRVAQRAVQQVLEPLFDPLLLDCSYGCRPHVGVPGALARVQRYAEQGLTWVVDADVATYFDSIDHRILLGLLRQRIDDVAVLHLIGQWLAVGALNQVEDVGPIGMLANGTAAVRRAVDWGREQVRSPAPAQTEWGNYDPAMAVPPSPAISVNNLWSAALMAQPLISGAKQALPYVQKIGGKRIALAVGVAAGALAAGELASRALVEQARGAPQGGALSPLLANIYLHPFDLALTSQGLRLVRFMDDFVIMCSSESDAQRALDLVTHQLATLRLRLNSEKTRILAYTDGLDFLGESLAPRQRGPSLAQGKQTFAEAERALQDAARKVRKSFRRQ